MLDGYFCDTIDDREMMEGIDTIINAAWGKYQISSEPHYIPLHVYAHDLLYIP